MRTLIYAHEEDLRAQEKLEALKAESRQAGRRNAELWEGNVEPAKAVIIFPNINATAIAEAYRATGIAVEVIQDEGSKEDGGNAEDVQTDEGQGHQAEKGRTRRVSK